MDETIFDRFTDSARTILVEAQKTADSQQTVVDSSHILEAIISKNSTFAHEILREYDLNSDQVRLVAAFDAQQPTNGQGLGADAKLLLMAAARLASEYEHQSVDTEHLLLAILVEKELRAHRLLFQLGLEPKQIEKQLRSLFKEIAEIDKLVRLDNAKPKSRRGEKQKNLAIEYFTRDLTLKAKNGEFDPIIGRETELNSLMQTLARRQKNNPLIVSDPGVGKTALIEDLATRLANGDVPAYLTNFKLLEIDLASLIAGTMYRGQFEERIKRLIEELEKEPQVIVFIDEIHNLIGAGAAEGSLDAANILKPALAKGKLRLIGATTHDEYRKHFLKHPALARRFQVLQLAEPDAATTLAILTSLVPNLEAHHGIKISPEALSLTVELANRYLPDRRQPDKSIDILDEAGASLAIKRQPNQLIQDLESERAKLEAAKLEAVQKEEFHQAIEAKQRLDRLDHRLALLRAEAAEPTTMQVTPELVRQIVSRLSGVRVSQLDATERELYRQLETELGQVIYGQDEAIATVAGVLRRHRLGLTGANRVAGSFIFLGPTGVGKTELAKTIAKVVYGTPQALLSFDMSDLMERHDAARLVGAPAGYVGYDEGGKLTEAVRRQPYSVVLLDEIEKAHPDIFNLLLQILDEGRLVDAQGRVTDFSHCIIIMTSNLGSQELSQTAPIGFSLDSPANNSLPLVKAATLKAVKLRFRPEFLNRLDHLVIFSPLEANSILAVVDRELDSLNQKLSSQGYQLLVTVKAKQHIAATAYDREYGARPVRRTVNKLITEPIASLILSQPIAQPAGWIKVDYRDKLTFQLVKSRTKTETTRAIEQPVKS